MATKKSVDKNGDWLYKAMISSMELYTTKETVPNLHAHSQRAIKKEKCRLSPPKELYAET